jgi:hypothetical protein
MWCAERDCVSCQRFRLHHGRRSVRLHGLPKKMARKGQLDALRGIAILLVLYTQFWNLDSSLGSDGVCLLFVLEIDNGPTQCISPGIGFGGF